MRFITSLALYGCLGLSIFTSRGFADSFTFNLIPADGSVTGPTGSTVGWGYSITNESATDWLLTSGLSADAFAFGTPNLLFDFPVLPPATTASQPFDAVNSTGLYELTWDATAPNDYTNFGGFTLSAQWWSGDPFNGGSFITDAPDNIQAYSATVAETTGTAPEPSTMWLSFPVMAFLLYNSLRILARTKSTGHPNCKR